MYDGEWTIGSLLATRAEQQPDREIVRFEDEALTYGGLDETANRVANALAGLGLVKGDRVAVMLGNRPEYLGLWFGDRARRPRRGAAEHRASAATCSCTC